MKCLQILLFGLLCCSVLMAQTDPSPTIFSQVGKAKLVKPGVKKKMKVRAGAALGQEGILILKKKATVGVFYEDGYTFLTGPGKFDVAPLRESSRLKESDFIDPLGKKLAEALDPWFYRPRSGFASGPAGSGGPSNNPLEPPKKQETPGHGNKEATIVPLAPLQGKFSGNRLNFSWEPKQDHQDIQLYELTITDSADKVIFRQESSGMSMQVDAEAAGLATGSKYTWKVSDKADADSNSGIIEFEFTGDSGLSSLLKRIRSDEAYQQADPAAKLMIEAATLDRSNFATEAMNTIQLAQQQYKKNPLVQAMSHAMGYFKGLREN